MMSHSEDRKVKMKKTNIIPDRSTFIFEDTKCPCCGCKMNAVTGEEGQDVEPIPGDVSVCFECTSYLVFDEELKLRVLEVDEICEMDSDTLYTLTSVRNQIQKAKRFFEENKNGWE